MFCGRKRIMTDKVPTAAKNVVRVTAIILRRIMAKLPEDFWEDQKLLAVIVESPSHADKIIAAAFSRYERVRLARKKSA